MASYIRPDDRWWIDWNGNGLYDHPFSDVTDDYDSYQIRYGADTESNPAEIKLTQAHGRLRLNDTHNRYDPGSVNDDISTRLLRLPRACKLESDGEILWKGRAVPTTGRKLTATEYADFELESNSYRLYRQPHSAVQNNITLEAYINEFMPASMSDPGLLRLNTGFKVGRVNYEGTVIHWINTVALYALGWCWENRHGHIGITSWKAAFDYVVPSLLTENVDRSWNPRREGHLFEHRPRYVKNVCQPVTRVLTTGDEIILQEWTVSNTSVGPGEGKEFLWTDKEAGGIGMVWGNRPLTVTAITEGANLAPSTPTTGASNTIRGDIRVDGTIISNAPSVEPLRITRKAAPDNRSIRFSISTERSTSGSWRGNAQFRLRLRGARTSLVESNLGAKIQETEISIPDFGEIVYPVPPWYPNRAAPEYLKLSLIHI